MSTPSILKRLDGMIERLETIIDTYSSVQSEKGGKDDAKEDAPSNNSPIVSKFL